MQYAISWIRQTRLRSKISDLFGSFLFASTIFSSSRYASKTKLQTSTTVRDTLFENLIYIRYRYITSRTFLLKKERKKRSFVTRTTRYSTPSVPYLIILVYSNIQQQQQQASTSTSTLSVSIQLLVQGKHLLSCRINMNSSRNTPLWSPIPVMLLRSNASSRRMRQRIQV